AGGFRWARIWLLDKADLYAAAPLSTVGFSNLTNPAGARPIWATGTVIRMRRAAGSAGPTVASSDRSSIAPRRDVQSL
ncbi:MAG: hypothetical protein O7I42_02830, partial [Alphaproteobacteria bacterium]|nr:hypothetical protein [Alphaproteobacteria bacterium]